MKKVFGSNREVAHVWAQQTQAEGKTRSMFFEGKAIYSYRHHFCIARFVEPKAVLFNTRTYSYSTCKHQTVAMVATSHLISFCVPTGVDDNSPLDHEANMEYYRGQIKDALQLMERARQKKSFWLDKARGFIEVLSQYQEHFGLPKDDPINLPDVDLIHRQVQEWKKKREKTLLLDLEKWRTDNTRPVKSLFSELPVALRIKNGVIETSYGARVLLEDGKQLFDAINKGRDVIGAKISYYTVNSYEGGTLKIGCHSIAMSEVKRIFDN